MQFVADGKTIKETSAILQNSLKTVEFHKNALMNEIGLRTTAESLCYLALNRQRVAERLCGNGDTTIAASVLGCIKSSICFAQNLVRLHACGPIVDNGNNADAHADRDCAI